MAYPYAPMLALDDAGAVVRSGSGQIYALSDAEFSTPLEVTDLAGVPKSAILISDLGITEAFLADDPEVFWKSGDYVLSLAAFKGTREAAESAATSAALSAQEAEDAAGSAASALALMGNPVISLPAGAPLPSGTVDGTIVVRPSS